MFVFDLENCTEYGYVNFIESEQNIILLQRIFYLWSILLFVGNCFDWVMVVLFSCYVTQFVNQSISL